jgi:GT2 family glycosyltransferase
LAKIFKISPNFSVTNETELQEKIVNYMNQLSIIIVSYNSFSIILKCLKDLLSSNNFRIIVVDNASRDGSAEKIKKSFPGVEIIALPQNIGYGRAANVGLCHVTTPYALLLNPDLMVADKDIDKLFAHTKTSPDNTAIWGPASGPEKIIDGPPQSVNMISGCAMLFDVDRIKKIGMFDENIFLYFEETDLCYRTVKAGYSIIYCGDIFFKHLVGQASTPDPVVDYMKSWHYGWSRAYYYTKHGLASGKKSPLRRFWKYKIKSWLAIIPQKRRSYRASASGIRAFIDGKRAFDETGAPYSQ